MPKAVKGKYALVNTISLTPANILAGVLVECDPSIKAIILKIDQEKHDYIVEDLDDQTLVIKESQLQRLKVRLGEVCVALVASREGLLTGGRHGGTCEYAADA